MPRIRLPIALSALILSGGLAVAGTTASASPTAAAAKTTSCKSSGATATLNGGYYLGLTAAGTSCATARAVQAGFQSCRLKSSQSGRCHAKVRGFTCREGKRDGIPTSFYSKVSCTHGGKKIAYTFSQNIIA